MLHWLCDSTKHRSVVYQSFGSFRPMTRRAGGSDALAQSRKRRPGKLVMQAQSKGSRGNAPVFLELRICCWSATSHPLQREGPRSCRHLAKPSHSRARRRQCLHSQSGPHDAGRRSRVRRDAVNPTRTWTDCPTRGASSRCARQRRWWVQLPMMMVMMMMGSVWIKRVERTGPVQVIGRGP